MSGIRSSKAAQAMARIPEIQEFTELGDFLAVPFRTYSAGMQTRLLFAVATAAHPEILLVDEVIGAGDAEFQIRAKKRMAEFIEKSSIFVLASHDATLLKTFCSKIYRLNHGQLAPVED